MAFYQNEDEDEQYNQGAQIGPESGQVGVSSSVGGAGISQPAQPKGDSSGSFVGIKNYLAANQNQGQKLGNQAAGIINQSADAARNQVSSLSNKFNQGADQGRATIDQDATNLAGTQAEKLNQDQRAQLKKQYNASYAGPQNLTDFNDDYLGAQKAVNQASNNVQLQGTEAGRKDLAKQINQSLGKNTRTSGSLDNLLLQAGGGKEKLQSAAEKNRDVVNSLTQAQESAAARAAQEKANADAIKNQTRGAIGRVDDPATPEDESSGAFKGLIDYLNGKVSAYDLNKPYEDALSDVRLNPKGDLGPQVPSGLPVYTKGGQAPVQDIEPGKGGYDNPNPYENEIAGSLFDQLGLQDGQNIYDVDLGKYIQKNPQGPRIQDLAGADDVARYQALADISGADPNFLSNPGSYNPLVFNRDALQQELGGAADRVNRNYNDLSDKQSALQNEFKNTPKKISIRAGDTNVMADNPRYAEIQKQLTDYQNQIAEIEKQRDYRKVKRGQ